MKRKTVSNLFSIFHTIKSGRCDNYHFFKWAETPAQICCIFDLFSFQILEELPPSAKHLLIHRVNPKSEKANSSQADPQRIGHFDVTTSLQHLSDLELPDSHCSEFQHQPNKPVNSAIVCLNGVVTVEDISGTTQTGPMTSLPNMMGRKAEACLATNSLEYHKTERRDSESLPLYKKCQNTCQPISDFLEDLQPADLEKYLIPMKFLRHFWVMDIVRPDFRNSCCFTKR